MKEKRYYRFGPFQLKPEERVLLRDGKELRLTDRAFDLLVFLVRNHGHLVRKDQIIVEVWPDAHVGESNLHTQINTLRGVLEGNYIQTIAKHGYRFDGDVAEGVEDTEAIPSPRRASTYVRVLFVALPIALLVGAYLVVRTNGWYSRSHKGPAGALYERALQYERAGDDDQALATLDQALAAEPTFAEGCVRAAYLSYELDENLKAIAYLARCKDVGNRSDATSLKAQALRELLADNSTRALELYQLLIDKYPKDPDSLYRFAEVATDLDRLGEADAATDACLALVPADTSCQFQRMYIRIKQNRFNDVLVQERSLPPSVRNYPWFDEPVGIALMGTGRLDQANEAFERLSSKQAKFHGSSHFTVGKEGTADVLLYQGRVSEATRRIKKVMETSDNAASQGGYLVYLGKIYALLGKRSDADGFAIAVTNTPSEPNDLTGAAMVLATIGDPDGVDRVLKARSQATQAGVPPAADHLIRGCLALAKGDTPDAMEELRLAHGLKPRDEEITYWLAIAYMKAGEYPSAITTLEGLEELKGTILLDDVPLMVPLISYRKAECYDKMGDAASARKNYAEFTRAWAHADESVQPSTLALNFATNRKTAHGR